VFVVFEGIDGSGKTTVSNLVVERLRARGLSVKHLRAEGKFASVVSESIRSLARDSKNIDLVPRAEFLLYVARDVQLVDELMADALRTHDVVVADRFLYTAEVLARFGRALPKSYIEPVISAAAAGLSPDLVVLVDVDPVLARARRKASKLISQDARPPSRKGLSGVGLSHRLRRGYLELAAADMERWVVLKNEAVLEQAVTRVTDLVSGAVREGARQAIARFRAEDAQQRASQRALHTPEDALGKLLEWLEARAQPEPQVAAYVLSGLSGPPVDDLRRALAHKVPNVILSGLSGLADDVSWELRGELVHERPHAVARSIGGRVALDPRAEIMRESLLAIAPEEVIKAMNQLHDEGSYALRERLFEAHAEAVMNSIAGHDGERAWALRHAYLKRYEKHLADDYEVARAVAKSVQGLGSDEAFELRERAAQAAPLSSLSALAGLSCERSFALRSRYLRRAPKLVMESLRRISAPRAWEMRRETVREIKEAVDSIAELDDEEAWQLREDYADVWPSTVVKSLGILADGERGERLIRRQLARHAENISLLKHAAAVALKAHHSSLARGPAFDSPDLED
jgi:dTMP kinase